VLLLFARLGALFRVVISEWSESAERCVTRGKDGGKRAAKVGLEKERRICRKAFEKRKKKKEKQTSRSWVAVGISRGNLSRERAPWLPREQTPAKPFGTFSAARPLKPTDWLPVGSQGGAWGGPAADREGCRSALACTSAFNLPTAPVPGFPGADATNLLWQYLE
jgi:hypothetical protein